MKDIEEAVGNDGILSRRYDSKRGRSQELGGLSWSDCLIDTSYYLTPNLFFPQSKFMSLESHPDTTFLELYNLDFPPTMKLVG